MQLGFYERLKFIKCSLYLLSSEFKMVDIRKQQFGLGNKVFIFSGKNNKLPYFNTLNNNDTHI